MADYTLELSQQCGPNTGRDNRQKEEHFVPSVPRGNSTVCSTESSIELHVVIATLLIEETHFTTTAIWNSVFLKSNDNDIVTLSDVYTNASCDWFNPWALISQ